VSKASEIRTGVQDATATATRQRPAEEAGVAGVVAGVSDPFAQASQLLVHLVIDKVPPIRHFLDKVTLDQAAADALAQRWSDEFSSAVLEQTDALISARESLSGNWEGEGAPKKYQDRQRELEDLAASLASACQGAGYLTSAVNELMSAVREKIIDMIATLVEMLMQRLAMVISMFWIPIVGEIVEAEFITEGVIRTGLTVAEITNLIERVEGVLAGVSQVAQGLGGAVGQVGQLSSALGESIQGTGASPLKTLRPVGRVGATVVGNSAAGAAQKSRSGMGGHVFAKTARRGHGLAGSGASPSAGTHAQSGAVAARSAAPAANTSSPQVSRSAPSPALTAYTGPMTRSRASQAGLLSGTNEPGQVTRRGSFRKGTEKKAWEDAQEGPNGGRLCPTCGTEVMDAPGSVRYVGADGRTIPRDWDISHNPSWTNRQFDPSVTRKEVLDNYNDGVGLECPSCNRSGGNNDARFD
jgi:hypothetical protein